MVYLPDHPEATQRGWVYYCTVMREKGECPLILAARVADALARCGPSVLQIDQLAAAWEVVE